MWKHSVTVELRSSAKHKSPAAIDSASHALGVARLNPIHALRYE
jgi:hypothetical protein